MTIKDLGTQIADVWAGLRPVTREMIVGALGTASSPLAANTAGRFRYDAHADWELSRLLTALDERAAEVEVRRNPEKLGELMRMAETCARVLEAQTESAEVFIQLAARALKRADYNRLDVLANALNARFSTGEICEIVRQTDAAIIRALGFEALAVAPVMQLVALIEDPLYGEIARVALEQQAVEFESEEARQWLEHLAGEGLFDE